MPYADHLALRNVWVASFVLSLSLLGDALLYVILPVHADAFGVSLVLLGFSWPSIVLSVLLPMGLLPILPSGSG